MGISRNCPIFGYPLLSRERVKLWRFGEYIYRFTGPIRIKAHKKFGEKGALVYPGAAQIFGYPLLSQEWVKLRTSNFVRTFMGRSEQKPMKNFGNSSRGCSQGVLKIFWAPTDRAHCAVIFAIAQLSHEVPR